MNMNITLEESTTTEVSPLLHEIITCIFDENKSVDSIQKDFMFALVVVCFIENGFLPFDNVIGVIDSSTTIDLTKCKSTDVYEKVFVLAGCERFLLKLIVSPLGSTVLINVTINELNSETYTVCLPISRYVVSPNASTIPMIFRDLKYLSTNLKNKILVPVKSRILLHYGHPSASLIGMPEEVLYNIMLQLPTTNVVNVSQTCKRLKYLLDNECLWHALSKRDFNIEIKTDEKDWKEIYKENYILHKETKLKQLRRAGTLHDLMDHTDFVSHIDNPMWYLIM